MSSAGYTALRQSERVVLGYYNDAPVNGNCTWGVGTLAHLGQCTPEELQRQVTPAQVDAALLQRVQDAERFVRATITQTQLTQDQFDAAVSFAYNTTRKTSRWALSPADTGNMAEVAARMRQSVMVVPRDRNGHPLGTPRMSHGLINRRQREALPFLGNQP